MQQRKLQEEPEIKFFRKSVLNENDEKQNVIRIAHKHS